MKKIYAKGKSLILTIGLVLAISLLMLQSFAPFFSVAAQVITPPKSKQVPQIVIPAPGGVKVNTWNGNMFYSQPLIGLSGRGIPISLSLNYNSSWHTSASAFG